MIERLAHIRRKLGVSYPVRLLSSTRATVPFVVGWLKPVILLPAGLLTGLSPVELEAILAHELAHVRRHDFLVNLVQMVIETLFFYHPAVWWASGQVRQEREHCCDQIAASLAGGRLVVARALLALEERRCASVAFGVAASGGSLSQRIRRLLGESPARGSRSGWPIAALSVVSGMLIALAVASGLSGKEQEPAAAPFVLDRLDVKGGRVVFKGKIDASQDLVLRIERKGKPHESKSWGRAAWFQVVVESYDKMTLEGGKTGHGIVFDTKKSSVPNFGRDFHGSGSTAFIALESGNIAGKFTIRRRADFVTKDGTVTFADITQKDGKKLPVSFSLEPRIE